MYEYKEAVPSQALQVPDGPAYGGRARGTLEACAECRVDLLGAHIELLGDGGVVGLGWAMQISVCRIGQAGEQPFWFRQGVQADGHLGAGSCEFECRESFSPSCVIRRLTGIKTWIGRGALHVQTHMFGANFSLLLHYRCDTLSVLY